MLKMDLGGRRSEAEFASTRKPTLIKANRSLQSANGHLGGAVGAGWTDEPTSADVPAAQRYYADIMVKVGLCS